MVTKYGMCILQKPAEGWYFVISRVLRKPTFWYPSWSDTNQAVQLQKMARGLKFWIKKVEGSYYLYSENNGADQLRDFREADTRLCFCICIMLVLSRHGSDYFAYFSIKT